MLRDSLDALRGLLVATFPAVTRIYVNTMPDSFVRPSFFVMLATGSDDDLTKVMYRSRATWQIVYFAPEASAGPPDALDQLTVADALRQALTEGMVVTGPSGTVYHILDVEGGPRDNEVYLTVRLEVEKTRPQPTYDLMQDIAHVYKEG